MQNKKPSHLAIMLRRFRESNDLTQEFVATQLNLSRSTYSYYEIGKTEPSLKSLGILAKMFGVTVEDFLNDETGFAFSDSKTPKSFLENPTTMGNLSAEERQIVAMFRAASPKNRKKAVSELDKSEKK